MKATTDVDIHKMVDIAHGSIGTALIVVLPILLCIPSSSNFIGFS
jgi:hypothetical protein